MATLGSRLITKQAEYHSNLTDLNNLGRMAMLAPHKMMGKMSQLFSAQNLYSNNPLSTMIKSISGGEIEIDTLDWEWEMEGADTRPLIVIENIEPASNLTLGKYKRKFRIKLDENWYKTTDVLSATLHGKRYNLAIIGGPVRHGDHYAYDVKLITKDDNDFVPLELVRPGAQWIKGYSISGEAAEKGGSTQFSGNLAFRNKLSKYRKEYRITDYASTAVLRVAMPDANGNLQKTWIRYADVKFMKQWYEELEFARWYSKSGDIVQDNGRPFQLGPGIQEQLQDSHIEYYNQLSTSLLDQYLMDIFYGRVAPGSAGRNITAFTGEYGMAEFHRAVSDVMERRGLIRNIEVFTDKVSSPYNNNAYAFGMQFVQYNLTNGGSLRLIHNPLYDNRQINSEIDPISGKPVESMRFTFLDFAGDGKSNIKVTKKKDGDFFTYVCGNYTPYGPAKRNAFASHGGDYYEMHIGTHEGIHIEDVTKCGELIYTVN